MYDNTSRVLEISIDEILPNRFQPRIQFDEDEILELSDSIKEHGVIQPLIVRPIGDKYEIIAGERRYKASVLAGKETVPVIVKSLNDRDSAEIALIENVQRKNLTPIEEALSYKKILDEGYITQEKLALKIGRSQSSIANKIRLLNLSDEVQEALLENKISERHARSLLKISNKKQQNEMLNRIINERLTVRRTDEEIAKLSEYNIEEEKEGKGEVEMDNNIIGSTSVPQSSQSTFDIFGVPNNQNSNSGQQPFDIFASSEPVQQSAPAVPQMPSMPVQPAMVTPQVEIPSTPVVPQMPSMSESVQPTMVAPQVEIPSAPVMPQMPSMSEPVQPTMVIPQVEMPSTPVMPQMPSMSESVQPTIVTPQVEMPSTPVMPQMPSMGVTEVSQPEVVVPQVEIPSAPVEPIIPTVTQPVESTSQATIFGGIQFDSDGNVIADGQPVSTENQQVNPVETLSPIIENPISTVTPVTSDDAQMTQQSENLFSFGTEPVTANETIQKPEPIIITDFSKQYDPVIPAPIEQPSQKLEFKEVINIIRDCANKIEQYGYKIDLEEYDLANLYQVVFKVEK